MGLEGLASAWSGQGAAMVSAFGSGGEVCSLGTWEKRPLGHVTTDVQCRGVDGSPKDSRFMVPATARH